ncbi:hypothetical protein [Sorangium sp. So ce1024]|uniref:hypothetical protein n=1 Tax=unclassified Sorangium TaxID=2621164 RepID=UPI003F01B794
MNDKARTIGDWIATSLLGFAFAAGRARRSLRLPPGPRGHGAPRLPGLLRYAPKPETEASVGEHALAT